MVQRRSGHERAFYQGGNESSKGNDMTIQLTDRELATILAALRSCQRHLDDNEDLSLMGGEHFDDQITPLTVAEIDDLCERLNCAPRRA
jgi:hypothetical protein